MHKTNILLINKHKINKNPLIIIFNFYTGVVLKT